MKRDPLVGPVLDRLPDVVIVLDAAGAVRYGNRAATALLGWELEEWRGRSAMELVHPDDLAIAAESLVGTVATESGRKEPLVVRVARAGGGWVALEVVANNCLDDPEVGGIVLVGREAVLRRLPDRAAEEVARRLDMMFMGAAIGMAQIAIDGTIIRANPRLASMLGVPADALVGTFYMDFIHPDDAGLDADALAALVRGEVRAVTTERRAVLPDGEVLHVQATVSVVHGPDGKPMYCAAQFVDVSERVAAELALSESEERYRLIVELAEEGVWSIDADSRTTFVNERMARMLGYERDEMAGRSLFDFMDEEGRVIADENLERRRAGIAEQHDFKFLRSDRTPVWTRLSASPQIDAAGVYLGATALVSDVTAERASRLEIEQSELRYRTLFDGQLDAVVVADQETFVILDANVAATEMYGWARDELLGKPVTDLSAEPDRTAAAVRALTGSGVQHELIERLHRRRDGSTFPVEITLGRVFLDRRPTVVGIIRDVTELHATRAILEHQAHHDPLTELVNRATFIEMLECSLAPAARRDGRVAVLFVDLDHFKNVNDLHGHAVGDAVLVQAARRLSGAIRREDTVARFGGDEFVVLCPGIGDAEAMEIARRIVATMERPVRVLDTLVPLGASVGVAVRSTDPTAPDELLSAADAALYRAKSAGRNQAVLAASDPGAAPVGRVS